MPVFIDLEASALENGYPIEVGWVAVDEGNRFSGKSFLIRTDPHWLKSCAWDYAAEAAHGISQALLNEKGLPPADVARLIDSAIEAGPAFTDNPGADGHWLRILFSATDIAMRLRLADVELVYNVFRKQEAQTPGEQQKAIEGASLRYLRAEQLANQLAPRTHRALDDALHLAAFFVLCQPEEPDIESLRREIAKVQRNVGHDHE
ncbi:MAG: hypothetical protein HQL44_09340 [Alphaproteobacteria bacterium]|nr:hypothetical protein [Alphaproteobacteria bacterium]